MRLTSRRALAAALAAPLLVSGLAACGSDSGSATEEPSSAAAGAEAGEKIDEADFIADLKAGIESATTAQMEMDMDLGQAPIHAEGEMDYSREPLAMDMTMESGMTQEPIELVLVDNVMYMNMGQMSNGKFIKYDLSDAKNLPPGMDQMADQLDPLASFDSMEAAVTSVTFEGDEDVDGEQLAHFEVTMDTSKIEAMKDIPAQAGVPKEVTYDLWLDDENRMRQMKMVMDMATTAEIEARIFDWGQPVDIQAPEDSEVVEAPPMQQMG